MVPSLTMSSAVVPSLRKTGFAGGSSVNQSGTIVLLKIKIVHNE